MSDAHSCTRRRSVPCAAAGCLVLLLSGCYQATRDEKDASLKGVTNTEQVKTALFLRSAILVAGSVVDHWGFTRAGDTITGVDIHVVGAPTEKVHHADFGMACALVPGDLYVTAAHCVEHPPLSLLRLGPDQTSLTLHPAVLWRDEVRDVALLYAPGGEAAPAFAVAQEPPAIGEFVVNFGNVFETSAGTVQPPWEEDTPLRLHLDLPSRKGDSGGPIMGRHGQLYGVLTGVQWRIPWFWIHSSMAARITPDDIAAARKLIPAAQALQQTPQQAPPAAQP